MESRISGGGGDVNNVFTAASERKRTDLCQCGDRTRHGLPAE